MENGVISGYSEHEIKQGKAIGFVPLKYLPVNKLISILPLQGSLIAAKFVDLDNKEQALINCNGDINIYANNWQPNIPITVDIFSCLLFPKFNPISFPYLAI